ncbi:MAG: SRPBCC family protein, partial [Endomicrobiales bacterium]
KTELIVEPGNPEFVIRRVFDVPRELVFKAYTDSGLIKQWWGGNKYTTDIESNDVRPGGTWRFVQHDAAGIEYAFHGVFHQVTPPEKLVYTFEFEGTPGHALLSTVTFEEQDGRTLLADRDAMLKAGMQEEMPGIMDRLAEVLAKEAEKMKQPSAAGR